MSDDVTVEHRSQRITMGGLGITYQFPVGDATLAFEQAVDATIDEADLNQQLDMLGRAVRRQRAIANLPQRREALVIAHMQLKQRIRDHAQQEADYRASYESPSHGGAARRGEWRPKEAERRTLKQMVDAVEQARHQITMTEYEIAKMQAMIDGTEPPEPPHAAIEAAMRFAKAA